MIQLTMFESDFQQADSQADSIIRLLAGNLGKTRALGVAMAKNQAIPLSVLLKRHTEKVWEWDFQKVWARFERDGIMVYAEFRFGFSEFCFYEDDAGDFYINTWIIHEVDGSEELGRKLTRKYLNAALAFITANGAQFSKIIADEKW